MTGIQEKTIYFDGCQNEQNSSSSSDITFLNDMLSLYSSWEKFLGKNTTKHILTAE